MKRNWIVLLGIIILGFGLRLFVLSQRGSFWFDEAFSVHFAAMDIRTMLEFLRFENNPPGYFILLHFWIKLLGSSELVVRSLSMIFGLASLPLMYMLGKRLHSSTAGLFAAFLLAISSFQVFYATETRMYSLYLFLTLIAVWLYLRLEKYRELGLPCQWLRVLFFFALVLLVWTHITAWFIVAALAVYILWKSQWNLKKFITGHTKFIILCALLVLQFLPWAVNFIKIKFTAPMAQGYFFHIPPDKNYFLEILETFVVFSQDNAFIVTIASVLIIGLGWFALRRPRSTNTRLLICWLFVPLFVGFAFQNAVPRYFIAVAPALYLLLGIGLAKCIKDSRFQKTALLVPVLLFALILPDYPSLVRAGHHEWDKLANWIEDRSTSCDKCLVLVNPHSEILSFERYYQGELPVIGFYPIEDNDDHDTRIVKTNWISLNTKENIRLLADLTKDYDQVFLATGGIDPTGRNIVLIWFWENGWQRKQAQEFGKISVMLLNQKDY